MIRKQIQIRKILIISYLIYCTFVVGYGVYLQSQAGKAVRKNALMVAKYLWHHEPQTPTEYLLTELNQHLYERVVITDDNNKIFIQTETVNDSWMDRLLMYSGLSSFLTISENIIYRQNIIGTIEVIWQYKALYAYLYGIVFFSLFLVALNFYHKFLNVKYYLEEKVEKRTAQLQQINDHLKQSEARFRSLFETAMSVILYLTPVGRIVEFNPEAERLYGRKREEVVGKSYLNLMTTNGEKNTIAAIVKEVLEGTPTRNFENWLIDQDGKHHLLTWNFSRMLDSKGQPTGIVCIGQDITERKHSEDALRDSERKFRSILDHTFQFIGLLEPDGTLIEANRPALEFAGINQALVKGKPFWEAPWWTHSSRLQQRLQSAIKRAAIGKPDHFEANHIGQDSTIIYVDCNIKPVFDEDDGVIFLIVEGYDITKRKQIEEALAEQNRFLETLIDAIPISIFYKNMEGKYTGCNKTYAELLGLRKDQIIGKSVCEIYKKELADFYSEADTKLLTDHGVQIYESQIDHSDGTCRDIIINKATFYDKDGRITGIIGAVLDISERKEAERKKNELESQLRQAHKMESIGTLAGGIAHDFNNILGAIIGYAELAQLDADHGTVLKANLDEVVKAANRAKDLINQILTFSRQSKQQLKPLQLSVIIKEVLNLLRASLPTTIEIRHDIRSDAIAMADPTQIHQVLMNLCSNAGHAMREKGGLLEVSLENVEFDSDFINRHPEIEHGPYLQLTVTDTGHGMPSEVLDRIFDPFFSTKQTGEGTGLGLSMVHGIVKSHGGTIYAYSEPGKGSSFKIYLPAIERRLKPKKREQRTLPKGSERILFVDDEQILVNVGKKLLKTLGYDVTAKNSSIEALQLFRSQPDGYDLVITDQTMPNMTGDQLAKALLAVRPDLPIIMCTGFSASITGKRAREIGIRSLLIKPIIMRDLAKIIRKVLDESYAEAACEI